MFAILLLSSIFGGCLYFFLKDHKKAFPSF